MRGRIKVTTAIFVVFVLMVSMLIPALKVFADGSYTITFKIAQGATGYHDGQLDQDVEHSIIIDQQSGDRIKIDGQIVEPRKVNNPNEEPQYTRGTDAQGNKYITITNGEPVTLNYSTANNYDLRIEGSQENINSDIVFSNNTNIEVVDHTNNNNPNPNPNPNPTESGLYIRSLREPGDVWYKFNNQTSETRIGLGQGVEESVQIPAGATSVTLRGEDNRIIGHLGANKTSGTTNTNIEINKDNFKSATGVTIELTTDQDIIIFEVEYMPNDQQGGGDQPGENPGQQNPGNTTANIQFKVSGPIEYREFNGYDETGVTFSINDSIYRMNREKANFTEEQAYEKDGNGELILDENNQPIPIKVPGPDGELEPMMEPTGVTINGDSMTYDKGQNDTEVTFKFFTTWNTKITKIKINDTILVDQLPSTRDQLIACYKNHCMQINVPNIPYSETYNIEVEARRQNENEVIMGNFLWDYNEDGYTEPEDKILNGSLKLIQVEYDGEVYDTPEEINALGGVYEWNNVVRKNKYTDVREGVGTATFPVGTNLTVEIIPDAGYQLINFGVNGGVFDAEEEVGRYTFEIKGGNFHLQAKIEQVDDVVKSKSDKIESGTIALGGEEESMAIGTARLDVDDIDLTEDKINNFKEAAGEYTISNYLDISLYNIVYKGTETDSWDTQVKELDNEATITLKLEDGVDGNEIVVVHEKHDGTYEIIPVEYDKETHTITFKTASFSNYAIATKTTKDNVANTPKTGDNIAVFVSIFAVAVVAFIVIKIKNTKKNTKH